MMQKMDNEMTAVMQEEDQNSLEHYGVKGQKWGQRNYQNPDGSYTELGKERRRVAFIREEKRKKEEADAAQNGEVVEEKIGGKAYKDMTRKELRAAKKRARHNEKERRAQREFNRDKRQAIDDGNLAFISKNINKFSNDEIDEAVVRYKRMQAIKDLEASQKKSSEHYMDKAIKFLDKASQATNSVTNIYNKINESQQRSIQKKKMEAEYDKLINPKKTALEIKKEKYELEKLDKDLDELKNGKKKTQTELLKEQYELEKAQKDLDKLRDPDLFKTTREIYEEEKARKDLDDLRNPKKSSKDLYDEEYNKAKAEMEKEIAKKNRATREAEEIKTEKAWEDYLKTLSPSEAWDATVRREEKKARESSDFWFTGQNKNKKLGSFFSKQNKEDVKGTDFDLDDKRVNSINKKYSNQLKKTSEEDYWKENPTRSKEWSKDLKKRDSDVIDKWVKDMKKKYMKERNMDSKAAEKKAEEYVDAWLDAYDEGKLF